MSTVHGIPGGVDASEALPSSAVGDALQILVVIVIIVSDVNKDLGLKAKAKDSIYHGQIFHRSSPYSVHHFIIVNVV